MSIDSARSVFGPSSALSLDPRPAHPGKSFWVAKADLSSLAPEAGTSILDKRTTRIVLKEDAAPVSSAQG